MGPIRRGVLQRSAIVTLAKPSKASWPGARCSAGRKTPPRGLAPLFTLLPNRRQRRNQEQDLRLLARKQRRSRMAARSVAVPSPHAACCRISALLTRCTARQTNPGRQYSSRANNNPNIIVMPQFQHSCGGTAASQGQSHSPPQIWIRLGTSHRATAHDPLTHSTMDVLPVGLSVWSSLLHCFSRAEPGH